MKSTESFQARATPAATLADVWRLERGTDRGSLAVRTMLPGDLEGIRYLQRKARPSLEPDTVRQLEHQMDTFPEGQLVAVTDNLVVGASASLVVQWDDYALEHNRRTVTGNGLFSTHDPKGRTLYVAGEVVDPRRRGHGVGRALLRAQRKLCQRLNLRRIIMASRVPGYGERRDDMNPELYAKRVLWGDIDDAVLGFHLSQGFQYCGVIRDYQPEDTDSGGHAALVVWLNPRYQAARPALVAR